MSLISISNLTFHYEGSNHNIFNDVSFKIDSNWKLGFIGRNGKGKTTFLKLLLGRLDYQGKIEANEIFEYFPFALLPGQEENLVIHVIEEIKPDYELWKICKELHELQVKEEILYRRFSTLSHGEQTKVMLAMLFSGDHHFLLIDEPTNHLDKEARLLVRKYLNAKKGFILVSHDRAFMDACVDHVLILNRVSITVEKGNFSSWWENKRKRDLFEQAENEKLKKEAKKLMSAARQSGRWADKVEATKIGGGESRSELPMNARAYVGEKSRKMQQRRKNLERRQEKVIQDKKALLKDLETTEHLKVVPLKYHKDLLVKAVDFGISYDVNVFANMSFEIRQGERIAFTGKNGCGKTSVLRYILGQSGQMKVNMKTQGEFMLASNLKISYVEQDTKALIGSLQDYTRQYGVDDRVFLAILRKLDFSREEFERDMAGFSEGQKKKVLIARSLCEQAHLYLWDEPLNFIDVFSRIQIEELLNEYKPTMLFVEHDSVFSERIATREIRF